MKLWEGGGTGGCGRGWIQKQWCMLDPILFHSLSISTDLCQWIYGASPRRSNAEWEAHRGERGFNQSLLLCPSPTPSLDTALQLFGRAAPAGWGRLGLGYKQCACMGESALQDRNRGSVMFQFSFVNLWEKKKFNILQWVVCITESFTQNARFLLLRWKESLRQLMSFTEEIIKSNNEVYAANALQLTELSTFWNAFIRSVH